VLADADLLLANCDALRGRIQETNILAGQRARVVYNGCDASAFRPARDQRAVRGRLGLAPHRRYLLTCASVARHKGMSELAAAWKIFSPRHPEWRLLVAGQVVERDQAALLRRSAQGTVSILGPVASGQVAAYMQAADAYVQPSRQEGLSNATMEAMACGLPVISTDAGGQGEVVTDQVTGWLIPGGDYRALLGAMFELVADAEHARRLGQAARRRIESDFRPPASTRRLSGMLATLAAGGAIADEHEHLENALGDLAGRRAVGA
jgi:glycosyltransferase involved in cell wall biosynthesis